MRSIGIGLGLIAVLGILMAPTGCKKETPETEPARDREPDEEALDDVVEPRADRETEPLLEAKPEPEPRPEETLPQEDLPDITPGAAVEP